MHLQRSEKATLIKFGIYLFHFFVFLWLATRHYLDEIRDGGNIWTTADWFVSYRYGFVRRGAIGTIIEFLSQDLMGDSLLLFVFLILHVLIGIYFLLICRIFVARVNFGAIPLVVLLLSPIYISFWLVNPQAYLRKEMLALLTLAYAIYSIIRTRVSPKNFALILTIWTIAILSHESALLIGPTLLFLVFHQFRENFIGKKELFLRCFSLIMIPLSTVLVLNKFKWLSPEFCSYIVNRKLSEVFCYEGGIAWAMRPEWYVDYMTSVSQTLAFYFPELIIIFLFVMLPILALGDLKSFYLTICLLVISIPLFMTTYDWGRWLFVIGHSVLLYTLATTNKIVSRKHTLMLFVFVPVNVMMQLPYCCSVSPIGGLLRYIDSLLKINLM